MKYTPDRKRTISGLQPVSKPGLRVYTRPTRRAPRARRPGRRRPVHQPGAHDRPRGAQAPRGRRGPLLRLVTEHPMSRIGKYPSPSRAASTSRIDGTPRHGQGPEGHPRARRPRRHHRRAGGRRRSSSSVPTTSARTGRCTASPARWSTTWSSASPTASARSSRSSASATAPPPQGPASSSCRSASPTRCGRRARGHHLRGARPDPHHGAGHRQGARRPGRRQHPQDPQARALQGQGRPLRRRARAAQGRQGGEVDEERSMMQQPTGRAGTAATAGCARRSAAPRRVRASPCSAPTSTSTPR